MRVFFIICCLIGFFCPGSRAQSNGDKFEFALTSAHPNAKLLMKEDFFWSAIDEFGPFGSDAGSDAAYGFQKWRKANPSTSPMIYLKGLLDSWAFPPLAWDELDTAKLKAYIALPYDSQKDMGMSYLWEIDEAIIGTAFAQFVIEGRVDPMLKYYAIKALTRQMLPIVTRGLATPAAIKSSNKEISKITIRRGMLTI